MSTLNTKKDRLQNVKTAELLTEHFLLEKIVKKKRLNTTPTSSIKRMESLKQKIGKELLYRGVSYKSFKKNVERMLPFQIKNPFIIVTGSVFYQTPHDLDFMVFTPLKIDHDVIAKKAITKLSGYLPSYAHWSNAFYGTPFSTYAPLYTLEVASKLLTRKYAPMFPKNAKGKTLQINLEKIVKSLPTKLTLISNFIYYLPSNHMFLIPRLPIYYHVPLLIRLQRMFPYLERPQIQTYIETPLKKAVPVYSLILKKMEMKVVEM